MDQGWTIDIDAVGDPASADDGFDDQLAAFEQALDQYAGAVAGSDARTGTARFSLDTASINPVEVLEEGLLIFHDAAIEAGLPPWQVVRCEILTYDEDQPRPPSPPRRREPGERRRPTAGPRRSDRIHPDVGAEEAPSAVGRSCPSARRPRSAVDRDEHTGHVARQRRAQEHRDVPALLDETLAPERDVRGEPGSHRFGARGGSGSGTGPSRSPLLPGVRVQSGAMALTRMPCSANSSAIVRVKLIIPPCTPRTRRTSAPRACPRCS